MTDRTRIAPARRYPPEPAFPRRPDGVADPRPDNCPECLGRTNWPQTVLWTPDGTGYYATYSCHTCRHDWWTGWSTEPLEVAG